MSLLKTNPVSESETEIHQDPDRNNYESIKSSHKRTEWSCLHWIKIGLMVFVSMVTLGIVGVYFFHLIAPDKWCWLSPNRLDALKDHSLSVASGLVVGLAITLIHEL